jgi:hypothetical protein
MFSKEISHPDCFAAETILSMFDSDKKVSRVLKYSLREIRGRSDEESARRLEGKGSFHRGSFPFNGSPARKNSNSVNGGFFPGRPAAVRRAAKKDYFTCLSISPAISAATS